MELLLFGLCPCTGTPGWWLHLRNQLLIICYLTCFWGQLPRNPPHPLPWQWSHRKVCWNKSTQTAAESLHSLGIKSRSLQTWVGSPDLLGFSVAEDLMRGGKKFQSTFGSKCWLNRYLVLFWKVNTLQCITLPLFLKQAAVASIFIFDSVCGAAPCRSD